MRRDGILFACHRRCFAWAPYRLFFFSNEGSEPPHVHVQRDWMLAKFWLQPVVLASSTGFRSHELRTIHALVEGNVEQLKEAWNEYFAGR